VKSRGNPRPSARSLILSAAEAVLHLCSATHAHTAACSANNKRRIRLCVDASCCFLYDEVGMGA